MAPSTLTNEPTFETDVDSGPRHRSDRGSTITDIGFNVLGEVSVTVDGLPIDLGTPKERQLLAVLLVAGGRLVPRDRVVDALWPDRTPAKPMSSLRVYLSHLRAALAEAGGGQDVIVTLDEGYRLDVDPESVDAVRLERAMHSASDPSAALDDRIEELDAALGRVRGEPFADMPYAEFAQAEIQRLDELVAAAHELRAELAIDAGDASAWTPHLTALVARYPFRDRLRAAHMRALAINGRLGDALRSFAEHRSRLIQEMGVEPGPELRAIEAELLAMDTVEVEPTTTIVDAVGPRPPSATQERRMVTVVAGIETPDAAEPAESLGPSSDTLALVADHHGGTIITSNAGALAAFGVPTSHGRDPELAIRAAFALATSDHSWAVGVATGIVTVVDGIGPPDVDGEPIDLARRLSAEAAPGHVVVDELTRRLTERTVAFVAGPDAASHQVVNVGSSEPTTTPMRGRNEELRLLVRRFEVASGGEGQTVVIGGEAGAGKTRLVQALLDDVNDRSLRIVRLACASVHQHTAFHPLRDHLRSRRRPTSAPSNDDQVVTAARRLLAAWLDDGDRALDTVSTDPDERRRALLRAALIDVTAGSGDETVVCIVEDVQWVDASTEEFVISLAETAGDHRVLLVVTHRTPHRPAVGERSDVTVLRLGALPRDITAEIAREAVGPNDLTDDLAVSIAEQAKGIPLFAQEMAIELVGRGGELPAGEVPVTLYDSLTARLDRITSASSTIRAAAVLGFAFDLDLLAGVAENDGTALLADVEQLSDAGIIVRRGAGTDTAYRFRHALFREIAHDSLLPAERVALHRRAAETLAATRSDVDHARLAHHWTEADDAHRALASWRRAAEQALAVAALREAVDSAERGLDTVAGARRPELDHDTVELHLLLGSTYIQLDGPSSDRAVRHYAAVLDGDLTTTPLQRFRALWGRWYSVHAGRDIAAMVSEAEQLVALSAELDDVESRLQAHHAMWSTLMTTGRFAEALWHVEQGRALHRSASRDGVTHHYGGHDPVTCMWGVGGLANWMLGRHEEGSTQAREGIAVADRLDHAYTQLEASFGPLAIAALEGDRDLLLELSDELDQVVATGQVASDAQGYVDGFRGLADLLGGDPAAALERFRRAAHRWRTFWGSFCLPLDEAYVAALLAAGDPQTALAEIDAVLGRTTNGPTWWDAEFHRRRAEALAASGEAATDVIESLNTAAEIARSQGALAFEMRALCDLLDADPNAHAGAARSRLDALVHSLDDGHPDVVRIRRRLDHDARP